jgi:hypothetical protein
MQPASSCVPVGSEGLFGRGSRSRGKAVCRYGDEELRHFRLLLRVNDMGHVTTVNNNPADAI